MDSHRSPRASSHIPVFRLLNYSRPWKPASRPLSQAAPLPTAAVTPQGLGPVVSGRNLGELCSLSSLGLGSQAGALTVENHKWFSSCQKPRKLFCRLCTWQDIVRTPQGPWLRNHLLVAPVARLQTRVASSRSHQREGQRAGLAWVLLPSSGHRPRTLGGWDALGLDPGACCPEPRVLGLHPQESGWGGGHGGRHFAGSTCRLSIVASLPLGPGLQ